MTDTAALVPLNTGAWKFTCVSEAPKIGARVPPAITQTPRKFTGTFPFTRSEGATLTNEAPAPKFLPFAVAIPPVESAATTGVLNPAPCTLSTSGVGVVTGGAVIVRLKLTGASLDALAVTVTGPTVWPSVTWLPATPLPSVVALEFASVAVPAVTEKLTSALPTGVPAASATFTVIGRVFPGTPEVLFPELIESVAATCGTSLRTR